LRLTGSPRALQLLSSDAPLPLLRVEPVRPACSISDAWGATLTQIRASEIGSMEVVEDASPKEPVVM